MHLAFIQFLDHQIMKPKNNKWIETLKFLWKNQNLVAHSNNVELERLRLSHGPPSPQINFLPRLQPTHQNRRRERDKCLIFTVALFIGVNTAPAVYLSCCPIKIRQRVAAAGESPHLANAGRSVWKRRRPLRSVRFSSAAEDLLNSRRPGFAHFFGLRFFRQTNLLLPTNLILVLDLAHARHFGWSWILRFEILRLLSGFSGNHVHDRAGESLLQTGFELLRSSIGPLISARAEGRVLEWNWCLSCLWYEPQDLVFWFGWLLLYWNLGTIHFARFDCLLLIWRWMNDLRDFYNYVFISPRNTQIVRVWVWRRMIETRERIKIGLQIWPFQEMFEIRKKVFVNYWSN